MKTEFTREEADRYLHSMEEDCDTVRLVDPENRLVVDSGGQCLNNENCHMIWGRCDRCENCTSLRALQIHGQAFKIEILNDRTYWVGSRYIKIGCREMVAETVKDVTDSLFLDSDQKDRIGKLIISYNLRLITDSLTGAYNRRFLEEQFLPSLRCCHDKDISVNLAFVDVDHFKQINDTYGHAAGDQVLKDICRFWKLHFNTRDKNAERLVIRYGGDEFLIISCGAERDAFEQEIRKYDSEMRKICYCRKGIQFSFDYSIGTAFSTVTGEAWSWESLLETADRNMYQVKKEK